METEATFRVAVIGAGIVGITFAHALIERFIPVVIYEATDDIRTTGGGINATPAGVRALEHCGRECYDAFREVATNHHRERPDLYWNLTKDGKIVEVTSKQEHGSMPRVNFIEALARRLPNGVVKFGSKLTALEEGLDGKLALRFENGTTENADIVIGCDGINSLIRTYVVGDQYPATFSHNVSCRGLISVQEAGKIVGEDLAKGAHLGFGDGDAWVFYPINEHTATFGYFYWDDGPWPYPDMTHKLSKDEVIRKMRSGKANSTQIALVELFPDEVSLWGIKHQEKPLPTYHKGRMAVMGDAAHASTPNLSSGAGMGYEDAAVCADLLLSIRRKYSNSKTLYPALEKALQVYSEIRMRRSQRVVSGSYEAGHLMLGKIPFDEAAEEYRRRVYATWDFDISEAVDAALRRLDEIM